MCLANACKDFMRLYEYAGWSESSLDLLAILYVLLCTGSFTVVVQDALSAVCSTQVFPRLDNAYSKTNHFNFKPICRTYPSVYLTRLRDYGQDSIFVKGRWCINQESESYPSCSQHVVLIRHTYLWSFVTIFLSVQKLWLINNILPRTYNSTVKNQGIYFLFLFHIVLMGYIFPGSFLKIA